MASLTQYQHLRCRSDMDPRMLLSKFVLAKIDNFQKFPAPQGHLLGMMGFPYKSRFRVPYVTDNLNDLEAGDVEIM